MILKSLTLENIRSYKDETTIEFPMGTTMFEGDIASGKSTILYAIEFGLFGLGSLKGSFLLRNGEKQGRVSLLFENDGKEYEVHRTLSRKGKSIQQGECYIVGPSGRTLLSPTEVKEKILQVLGFNEPASPKAQSVIYRYAIFTPQDEMKEVILKDPDERLQTLRRAFRIEEYKVAAENSRVVVSRIRDRISYFEGTTEDLPEARLKLSNTQDALRKLREELDPLKKRERETNRVHEARKQELEKLKSSKEQIEKSKERAKQLKDRISDMESSRKRLIDDNKALQQKIDKMLRPKIAEYEAVKKPTEKTMQQLKEELNKYKVLSEEKQNLKAKVEERMQNFNTIVQDKICPICERPADSGDFREKIYHLEKEKADLEKVIQKSEKDFRITEELIEELGGYKDAQKQLLIFSTQLNETNTSITSNQREIMQLDKKITELRKDLKSAEDETKPLQEVVKQIDDLIKEVETLSESLAKVRIDIAKKEQNLTVLEKDEQEYLEKIALKEKQLKVKDSLNEHKIWLSDYFGPTVENIEKHVMTSLNQKFNQQFQRWFQVLMDDPDLQVRVDEDFSPVIEREGYEQDYSTLCGGEKTSVALAYRLALNTTVQQVATGGGTNLLILDEPTDGFSKEQLFKIRDILEELKCPQVILVSHDRELEGFADHVFKVERQDGASLISQ